MGVDYSVEGGYGFSVSQDTKPTGKFLDFVDGDGDVDQDAVEDYVMNTYSTIGFTGTGNLMGDPEDCYFFFYVKSTHFYISEIWNSIPMTEIDFGVNGPQMTELQELQAVSREFNLSRPKALVFMNVS